jgi:drug/metabolite transporter (DMT)-like permease
VSRRWGYIAAVVSAFFFGISSTFNKLALTNVNPTVLAGLIYFIGGVVIFAIRVSPLYERIISLFGKEGTEKRFSKRDYATLAVVIVCGSVLAPFLLLNGLAQTTAINASLLLNAEAFFTFVIAFGFLKERCSSREYWGILLMLVAVLFVTTNGEFWGPSLTQNLLGNLLIVCSCFFWGVDNNLSKFLSVKTDIITVTGVKCLIGGIALLALCLILGLDLSFPLDALPYLLSVGAFSVAFSVLLYLFALRKIGSMRTGVIFSMSSLFGVALAFVALGESFTVLQATAGLLMIVGAYVVYRCGGKK